MEYEYSFEVNNLKKYINYCKKNKYKYIGKNIQERIIYRKSDNTIARITINNKKEYLLDFKDDKLNNNDLIVRKETPSIKFNDIYAVERILDFLNYRKDNTLFRTRYVYKKDDIKFELDEYIKPKITYVVAIEGEKTKTDFVYQEIKKLDEP